MPLSHAIILSDLHLGPDAARAPLHDARPLEAFLLQLAQDRDLPPTELVLAGDVFDFLCCEGYQGLDPARAPELLSKIMRYNQPVIDALRHFLHARNRGHRLTVLAGNHDPELLLPSVRTLFERALDLKDGVLWTDDQPLVPAADGRWPVWGRQLGSPDQPIWVIHGDRWDPVNAIHRDHLREAVRSGKPFPLPPGSSLVHQVLTPLKLGEDGHRSRPWLEHLKPEASGALLLLLYLDPERTGNWLRTHSNLSLKLMRDKVNYALLKRRPLFGQWDPTDLNGDDGRALPSPDSQQALGDDACNLLAEVLETVPEHQRTSTLQAWTEAMEHGVVESSSPTLASHQGALRWLARDWFQRIQQAPDFLAVNGVDDLPRLAKRYLPENLALLVAGHTHGPRWKPAKSYAYLNTGTWIGVGRIPPGDLETLIDRLDVGIDWEVAHPRTFARVSWSSGSLDASLWASDEAGNMRCLSPPLLRAGGRSL